MRTRAPGVLLSIALIGSVAIALPPGSAPPDEVVSLVKIATGDDLLVTPASGGIVIGGERHLFETVGFDTVETDDDGETPALIGVFANESGFVVLPVDDKKVRLLGVVMLILDGDELIDQHASVYEIERLPDARGMQDGVGLGAAGVLLGEGDREISYALAIDIGAGTSTFRIEGDTAYLNGDLGSITYRQVRHLIENHPEVVRIVFERVPGSVNDEVNVLTGRLVRNAGYATELLPQSVISSGGVDLFLAGEERVVADGARIGVHSWGDPGGDTEPADLPRDHPAHAHHVSYFSEIMPNGVEFYFYTLRAAAFEDIHWMAPGEISHWGLATD